MLHRFWLFPHCPQWPDIYSLLFQSGVPYFRYINVLKWLTNTAVTLLGPSGTQTHLPFVISILPYSLKTTCQCFQSLGLWKSQHFQRCPLIHWKAPMLSHWELFCCVFWNVRSELLTVGLMVHMSNIRIPQGLEFASTLSISTDGEPLRQDQVAVYFADVFV